MASPQEYSPSFDFSFYQQENPSLPLPGFAVDSELNEISISINEIITNLNLIQRSDGFLANQSVGFDQLNPALALATGVAQQWLTLTAYGLSQLVLQTGAVYKCLIAHTSGTFATDLAAGKWVVLTGAGSIAMAPVISAATLAAARTAMGLGAASVEALGGVVVDDGSGNLTVGTNTVTNAMLVQGAAYTIKGNGTSSTANETDMAAYLSGPCVMGFASRKNPGFRNNQMKHAGRGTSGTAATGQDNYTLDAWNLLTTGHSVTWQQGSQYGLSDITLSNYLQINGDASNTNCTLRYRMPGEEAGAYAGKRCIISLTATNNTTGGIQPKLTVKHANSLDAFSSGMTTDTSAAVMANYASGGFGQNSYIVDISSSAYLGLEFDFDLSAITNNQFNITGFEIEPVSPGLSTGQTTHHPTPKIADMTAEKARNQAYLPSYGGDTGIIGVGEATSTSAIGFWIKFDVPTRIAPTALAITTVGNLEITDFAGSDVAALTGITFGNATKHGAFVTATVSGTPLTSAKSYQLRVKTGLAGNLIFTGPEFVG